MTTTYTTTREIRDMISLYSDLHKEVTGVRPRLRVQWDVVEDNYMPFVDAIWKKIDRLQDELDAVEQDRANRELARYHEVEAFREKLAKLGLNPERYLHLA